MSHGWGEPQVGNRRRRFIAAWLIVCVMNVAALSSSAQISPPEPEAGVVTARLPEGLIHRSTGSLVIDRGTAVLWEDLVITDARGRARISLGDGSSLNIGSGVSLLIHQHNQQSRQTQMTLNFGKLRCRLQTVDVSQGEQFEVRTNNAVLGVIGTDFFVEALATSTRIIVYEGLLLVRNINPSIVGAVRLGPGEKVTVYMDRAPLEPELADPAEVQRSIEDTSVEEEESEPAILVRRPSPKPSFWSRNKWLLPVAAALTAAAIAIALNTGGGETATGCTVPEPECPIPAGGP
jgi:hypothetical protein